MRRGARKFAVCNLLRILYVLIRNQPGWLFNCADGRRPMYLWGLPLHCLGSIGVGTAKTIPQLMVFRFVQGFGTSGGIAVGQWDSGLGGHGH